mmetsp:Transcript_20420/g.15049  ORF Transcript_20420/g.15049 Transcript_20420/m.15049 type:complete len:108 (-) Transcript_20420:2000-2323(-)
MLMKMEEEQFLEKLDEIQEALDYQLFNKEVNLHILERIRVETTLIKEKVKEKVKVIHEVEKKMNEAKILDVYLGHSMQEVDNEKNKVKAEVKTLMLRNEKAKNDMMY